MVKIRLNNGELKETELPCYVLQAYFNGRWNVMNVYPYTKQGYEEARAGLKDYDIEDMRIEIFN